MTGHQKVYIIVVYEISSWHKCLAKAHQKYDFFIVLFQSEPQNQAFSLECVAKKMIFLFLNQNTCCWYSKEPSQWDGSFEHPKHMLKLMGKKIFTILCSKILFI